MNRVILIGRLVADPALRYTQSGKAVCKFTLAVDRRRKEDGTDFVDTETWQKLAELCANHLGKGRMVCVEGRLKIDSYEDQSGVKRKRTTVVADNVQFLDWPRDAKPVPEPDDDLAGLDMEDDPGF